MIDIHCHLLPQLDDGSRSAEDSLSQLRLMSEGGISHAFLTSHFMSGHYEYDRADYDARLQNLRDLARANGIDIKLHPGFEIYLHPKSLENIIKHNLVLGNSRYILVESDLNGLPEDFYANIFPLLRKGYRPILAHAERYVSIMQKTREAKNLIDLNVYMQVNAGSLVGAYGEKVRQTAWILVRNGWAHLLGSDDHARAPFGSYFRALELLREELDGETADLLSRDFPQMVLDDQPIPYKYVYVANQQSHRKRSLWQRLFG
ncbi:MAG: capsular biosynthesis protein [Candidatus Syntrophosphaera sp.]|nr:capsular biosynthesis protein [Candidatus Syntrophosphaera sp.]